MKNYNEEIMARRFKKFKNSSTQHFLKKTFILTISTNFEKVSRYTECLQKIKCAFYRQNYQRQRKKTSLFWRMSRLQSPGYHTQDNRIGPKLNVLDQWSVITDEASIWPKSCLFVVNFKMNQSRV